MPALLTSMSTRPKRYFDPFQMAASAQRLKRFHRGGVLAGVAPGNQQRRPRARKPLRHAQADAAVAAGDDCDPAVKIEWFAHASLSLNSLRDRPGYSTAELPPSRLMLLPVTKLASAESRKAITLATSSARPTRPSGMSFPMSA